MTLKLIRANLTLGTLLALSGLVLLLSTTLIGCDSAGNSANAEARRLCAEDKQIFCEKAFLCLTQEEREDRGLNYTSAEVCTSELQRIFECDSVTVDTVCRSSEFQPAEIDGCLDQLSAQTCDGFVSGMQPAVCLRVCEDRIDLDAIGSDNVDDDVNVDLGEDQLLDTQQDAVGSGRRFVRIVDQSGVHDTFSGGADMDAVVVQGTSGTFYAESVTSFTSGNSFMDDPNAIIGPPDSFTAFPDVSECDLDSGFFSMGGSGGEVVVAMQAEFSSGDTITVLEVGGCMDGPTPAIADSYAVYTGETGTGPWTLLGNGEGPSSFTVSF